MFLAAIGILYISFVMASLDRVIDDEKFDRLRKIEIAYINSRGENLCYKLPESRVLPNNIFYWVKESRDNLWIYFSRNQVDKLRMLLLLRDKKIEEVLSLQEEKVNPKLIERQMKKIKKASNELDNCLINLNANNPEAKDVQKRVQTANEFYDYIENKFLNNEKIENCHE